MRWVSILLYAAIMQMLWMMAGCCDGGISTQYRYTGISVGHLNTSMGTPMESRDHLILTRAYGIRMQLTTRESFASRSIGFPSAMACTDPGNAARDRVIAIRITAIEETSGAIIRDVTDEFGVYSPPYLNNDTISIPGLTEQMNSGQITQADLLHLSDSRYLNRTQFIVSLELASGTMLADTTDPVTLF